MNLFLQRQKTDLFISESQSDHFGVLPFDIEKREREDDPYDCPVEKLKTSGCAEVGFKQVCPGCPQQPQDGEGYHAVGAQHEEEAVTQDVAADGTEFVEEVDNCGEARGHLPDMGEGSAQAAAVVHQGPGNVKEGEGHREI